MKSIKTTAILALVSLSAVATGIKPASGQTGYDPWNGNTYDTSECAGYNSCYVDNYGTIYGSNNWEDPYHYDYDNQGGEYHQLQQY